LPPDGRSMGRCSEEAAIGTMAGMAVPRQSRRVPPKERSRSRILAAATRLIAERGLESLSYADIAKAAHISRPLIYFHFKDRDQLFYETVARASQILYERFAEAVAALGATVARPPRKNEPQHGPRLSIIRQRSESIFFTLKDLLGLERHGARTLANLHARIALRLLALAACITLNHRLGRPSRAIADYTA